MRIFRKKEKEVKKGLKLSTKIPEELVPMVLDNIAEGILLISRDFRILWANKKIIDLTHLKGNEIIDDFCYKITHHRDEPCQPPHDICPVEDVLKTGKPTHVIHTHFDKEGNEVYAEVSAYPVKDEKGEITQFVHIARDVTDRVKAERALVEAKDYTDNIIKSMIDTLIVVDPDAKIKTINKATSELLGYAEDELIDKPVATIFAEEEEVTPFKGTRMKKLIEQGSIRDYEMTYKTKSGEKIPVSFSGSVMRDKEGNLVGIVGIARDMREIKKLQAQLVQAGKMAAMGTLGAGIAHQLNQPLAGIRGFTQVILTQIDKKSPFYEDLKRIEEQTGYMRNIILNVSGFARQAEFRKHPIDINEPVEKSLQLLSEQLRLHGVKLVKNLDPKLPKVNADANQMQQIFINFVTNSREALDGLPKEAKKELVITTKPSQDGKQVEIIFKDTGSGIVDEIKDRIFEPFFTTKGPKSTGLGLSLNYGMIRDHGGVIEFESRTGKGTTFVVRLPTVKSKK